MLVLFAACVGQGHTSWCFSGLAHTFLLVRSPCGADQFNGTSILSYGHLLLPLSFSENNIPDVYIFSQNNKGNTDLFDMYPSTPLIQFSTSMWSLYGFVLNHCLKLLQTFIFNQSIHLLVFLKSCSLPAKAKLCWINPEYWILSEGLPRKTRLNAV